MRSTLFLVFALPCSPVENCAVITFDMSCLCFLQLTTFLLTLLNPVLSSGSYKDGQRWDLLYEKSWPARNLCEWREGTPGKMRHSSLTLLN